MLNEFNCARCGEYNPQGNTHCYACLSPRPLYCHHCGVNNNPPENTYCYHCGQPLTATTYTTTYQPTYVVETHGYHGHHHCHDDRIFIDADGDGDVDIIID